jgi:hypothetical protein
VMRPNVRLVALTSDARALTAALPRVPSLARRATYAVRILGQAARVYVFERV